jgi:archaellum biogenesis ATPase FlaH
MNTDEILKSAIMLHSDTRDAVRWAIKQERAECAKLCEESRMTTYELQRQILIDYLQLMVTRADWHGVSDAANDLRVLEAENGYFDREQWKNGS